LRKFEEFPKEPHAIFPSIFSQYCIGGGWTEAVKLPREASFLHIALKGAESRKNL